MRIIGLGRWKTDEGATLIEFCLVAVLLVMVLLGVVEMGRMILVYTTMANSARAGARYAIVHGGDRPTGSGVDDQSGPSSYGQVSTVVSNFASAGLLDPSKLTITVDYPDSSNAIGSRVDVTVTYPYNPMIGYFSAALSKNLSSTSAGIIEF
jgi:Flp pilus assembly protein TadG